jgi:hypothetical protein
MSSPLSCKLLLLTVLLLGSLLLHVSRLLHVSLLLYLSLLHVSLLLVVQHPKKLLLSLSRGRCALQVKI